MKCSPKRAILPCLQLVDKKQLKQLHSTLYKYGNNEFVCEQGAPAIGGWIVLQRGRLEYVTDAKFKAAYDVLPEEADAVGK